MKRGNCYVATEALWYILGGRNGQWEVKRIRLPEDNHWFLQHRSYGTILDPSRLQFGGHYPHYNKAVKAAFLTKQPSKRAAMLIETLTWQSETQLKRNIRVMKRALSNGNNGPYGDFR